MHKFLLMSVLIATIGLPIWFARSRNPKRSLPKMQIAYAIFCGIYVFAILYL